MRRLRLTILLGTATWPLAAQAWQGQEEAELRELVGQAPTVEEALASAHGRDETRLRAILAEGRRRAAREARQMEKDGLPDEAVRMPSSIITRFEEALSAARPGAHLMVGDDGATLREGARSVQIYVHPHAATTSLRIIDDGVEEWSFVFPEGDDPDATLRVWLADHEEQRVYTRLPAKGRSLLTISRDDRAIGSFLVEGRQRTRLSVAKAQRLSEIARGAWRSIPLDLLRDAGLRPVIRDDGRVELRRNARPLSRNLLRSWGVRAYVSPRDRTLVSLRAR